MATDFLVELILSGHDVFLLKDQKTEGAGYSSGCGYIGHEGCAGYSAGGGEGYGYGASLCHGCGKGSCGGGNIFFIGSDKGTGDTGGAGTGDGSGLSKKDPVEKRDKYGYRLPR